MIKSLQLSTDASSVLKQRRGSVRRFKQALNLGTEAAALEHELCKRHAFEALDEVYRLGNGEITEKTEPLVQSSLKLLLDIYKHQDNWHMYPNLVELEIEKSIPQMVAGYKYASGSFRHIFDKAATNEFRRGANIPIVEYLALILVRLAHDEVLADTGFDPRVQDLAGQIVFLSATYLKLGDLDRALSLYNESRQLIADIEPERRYDAYSSRTGTDCLVEAIEPVIIELIKENDLETARQLAEVAVQQTDHAVERKRSNQFARMTALLAKVCVEQGDVESTIACLTKLGAKVNIQASKESTLEFLKSAINWTLLPTHGINI